VLLEIRRLIREMSVFNPLWRAPRIHGELLKLGIDVGQTCPYRKSNPLAVDRESGDAAARCLICAN
jgi:hypothetical protein